MYKDFTVPNLRQFACCVAVAIALAGCGSDSTGTAQSVATTSTASTAGPVFNGIPPTTAIVGANYDYVPSVSDSNSHVLSYDITNMPVWATFVEATGELSGMPQASDVGMSADIEIGVTDGTSRATAGPFRIRVLAAGAGTAPPVAAPTISGTPASKVTIGNVYSFTPTAIAASGDVLSFFIVNRPAWATFSTDTGELSGTPTSADEGTFGNIVISVSGISATVSLPVFSIQVQASDDNTTLPVSIAIAPLVLRVEPGATQQLTVTGTFSDGSTQILAAANETFSSSNSQVASVSAAGIVTVAANAAVGATATISASDSASGTATSSATSAVVTVVAPGSAPTPTSRAAATATAQNNPLCGAPVTP